MACASHMHGIGDQSAGPEIILAVLPGYWILAKNASSFEIQLIRAPKQGIMTDPVVAAGGITYK